MSKKMTRRIAVTRVLLASLVLGLAAAFTATAAPGGSFAFLDSVKEFLGIQRAEVSVLKEQPKAPQLMQTNEPTIAPLVLDGLAPEVATTLAAGDIAFTGYNGTTTVERFSFVLLKDIGSGTQVSFTDNAYTSASGPFASNETLSTVTFNADYAAGSRFYYESSPHAYHNFDGTTTNLSTSGTALALANGGDEVSAFQGTLASPTSIIACISSGAFINTGSTNNSNTYLPAGLTVGDSAITLNAAASNGVLNSGHVNIGTSVSGTPAAIRTLIANVSHWTVSTSTTLTVPPAITFTIPANQATLIAVATPSTVVYGNTSTLSTTGGSGTGAVTFSAGASTGCSVAATTLSVTDASGSCSITATKAADASFNAATSAPITVTLQKASQTITFGALANKTFGDIPFTVSATGGASGNPVTFGATGNCTSTGTNGTTITITGAGSCTVTASQAGNTNYNAAANFPQSFSIAQATQTITFGALSSQTLGTPPITVSATGGASGNPVTFVASGGNCTSGGANGATITLVSVGNCVVTASQAGNANYSAAVDVMQDFDILAEPVITVTGGPLSFADTGVGFTSAPQSYMVSGVDLTNPITVTSPSTDFQVSLTTADGDFGPEVTVNNLRPANNTGKGKGKGKPAPQGGNNLTIDPTPIYVRFKPQSACAKSGNVTNTSNGAVTKTVGVSGTGLNTYTLTYTAGANGAISGTSPQTVASGGNGSAVTAVPDTGYHFVDWTPGGSTANPRTDTSVTGNISVTANFAINTYEIEASAGTGGTIAPNGVTSVNYNASQAYTITPDAGYRIADVLVDSVSVGAVGAYTFLNVTATHTIAASFELNNQTFNTTTTLPAGSYNNIVFNSPAIVTLTGDVDIQGCVTINSGATVIMGGFVFNGPGCFTLDTGATLRTASAAGITASGPTGSIQVGGTRTFDSGASYVYNGTTNQAVGNGLPGTVANLTINNSGADGNNTVTGNGGQIVTGMLAVEDGVYESHSDYHNVTIMAAGTLTLTGPTTVSGDWVNQGGTLNGNFPVTFDGLTGQSISGNTTFYGLTKAITTPAQTFFFEAGSTTTVTNALTLTGTAGNLLSLRSDTAATQWNINATGTRSVDYVDVQDSDATGSGSAINGTHSADSGNNTNWTFIDIVNYTIDVTQTANGTISPDDTVVTGGSNQTFYIVPDVDYNIATLVVDGTPVVPVAGSYTFMGISANHTITATYAPASCRTISIAALTSNTGVPVTVPVNTTDVTGGNVISADFKVTYDPAVITPVAGGPSAVVTAGTVLPPSGTLITANTGTPGTIEVSISGTTPFTGTGTLVDLHFNVVGAPSASTALTLSPISGPGIYYNGGTVCATATSGSLTVTANTSSTVVTSSSNPSVYGDSVTFTATVSPASTGGTVQFVIDGSNAGSPVAVVGGVAEYTTSALTVAGSPHTVTGNYSGFDIYGASSGTLTGGQNVTPAPVTITANDQTRQYGAADPTFTFSTSGLLNGNTLTTNPTCTTTALAASGIGTYPITCSGATASTNYSISYVAGTLTITTAALTITANDQTRQYGAANPTFTFATAGLVNGDSLTTSPTCTTTATAASGIGTYPITCSGAAASANYTIGYAAGTLTITTATVTITANDQTRQYGAADPSFTFATAGLVSPDTLTAQPTCTSTATVSSGIGPYPITCSGATASANYTISYVAGTLTITTATITITANNQTRQYGAADPSFTFATSGLVSPDTLTASPTCTTTATVSSGIGTYPITCSGATASANYTISYVAGTLTITTATITITANNQTRQYGAADPSFTFGTSGLVSPDTLTASPTCTTTATVSSGIGTYPITCSGATASANYTISYVAGTLTITTATITITANNQTRQYGAADPSFTFATAGLVNGDSLTTSPTCTTTATVTSDIGTYPITCAGATASANYTIGYAAGTLTITTATITITANNQTRQYGAADPSFTFATAGLVNGDSLTTSPTCTTTAIATSGIGTYPINCSGATASANYTISYVAGTLTITTATITITANDQTRQYGAADPTFTFATAGLVNGDSLTTSPTCTTTAIATSGIGTYPINCSGATASANYTIGYAAGTLTITTATITITANDQTRQYGAADPSFTFATAGLVNGDSLTTSPTCTTTAIATSGIGTYPINCSGATASANYTISYVAGTLTITLRPATWTTNPASKTFGDADPVPLTTGSGDFLPVDGVTATYSRVAGEAASGPTYHITATLSATGSLSNYSITNSGAEFTINARTLTGTVTYENATPGAVPIKQTTLTSTGLAPLPAPVQSDLNGDYSLTGFGTTSYTITPTKAPYTTNQFNGIFANDASLIAQHVVHLITLNAAQQKAADVSGIGAITSFDASLVAQYIVGIPNGLNGTGTWTFTPASMSLIVTPGSVRDFTGILMGDVSGDWNPAGARPAQLIGKDAASSVRAVVPNVTAAPGTAFTVPFRIENLGGAGVKAYQFDIEYNAAVVSPASIAATVNGTQSEGLSVVSNVPMPGLLKVVVFGAFPVNGDGVYVNLQFSAIGAAGSSSPLNIREFRLDEGQTPVFTIDGSLTVASATNENSIQGRLLTPFGAGVSNATVVLTGTTGRRVNVISGGMGYFEFGGLVMGETYTVSVRSKRFTFTPRTVSVSGGVTNVDMIAEQ